MPRPTYAEQLRHPLLVRRPIRAMPSSRAGPQAQRGNLSLLPRPLTVANRGARPCHPERSEGSHRRRSHPRVEMLRYAQPPVTGNEGGDFNAKRPLKVRIQRLSIDNPLFRIPQTTCSSRLPCFAPRIFWTRSARICNSLTQSIGAALHAVGPSALAPGGPVAG